MSSIFLHAHPLPILAFYVRRSSFARRDEKIWKSCNTVRCERKPARKARPKAKRVAKEDLEIAEKGRAEDRDLELDEKGRRNLILEQEDESGRPVVQSAHPSQVGRESGRTRREIYELTDRSGGPGAAAVAE